MLVRTLRILLLKTNSFKTYRCLTSRVAPHATTCLSGAFLRAFFIISSFDKLIVGNDPWPEFAYRTIRSYSLLRIYNGLGFFTIVCITVVGVSTEMNRGQCFNFQVFTPACELFSLCKSVQTSEHNNKNETAWAGVQRPPVRRCNKPEYKPRHCVILKHS